MRTQYAIKFTQEAFEKLGLELPKPVSQAFADLDTTADRMATALNTDGPGLATAWIQAIDNGKDPTKDAGVQQALLTSQLATLNIGRLADEHVRTHAHTVLQDQAYAIKKALYGPHNTVVATLRGAIDTLGPVAYNEAQVAQHAVSGGTATAIAAAELVTALRHLNTIRQTLTLTAQALGHNSGGRYAFLTTTDTGDTPTRDLETFAGKTSIEPTEAIRRGWTPILNRTRTELDEAIVHATAAETEQKEGERPGAGRVGAWW